MLALRVEVLVTSQNHAVNKHNANVIRVLQQSETNLKYFELLAVANRN